MNLILHIYLEKNKSNNFKRFTRKLDKIFNTTEDNILPQQENIDFNKIFG